MSRVKACLNGARERKEHPALPVWPAELPEAARAVVAAGELGAAELVRALGELRIGVEAGLETIADANLLVSLASEGLAQACLRVLVEVRERNPAALTTSAAIDEVLGRGAHFRSARLPRLRGHHLGGDPGRACQGSARPGRPGGHTGPP